jgi:hypothetical protein
VPVGTGVVAGETDAEALHKLDDDIRHAGPEAGLAHFAAGSGLDVSRTASTTRSPSLCHAAADTRQV